MKKKPAAPKRKRRVGLLGQAVTDSDDDSDYKPSKRERAASDSDTDDDQPLQRRAGAGTQRKRAAAAAASLADVPLAQRLRQVASNKKAQQQGAGTSKGPSSPAVAQAQATAEASSTAAGSTGPAKRGSDHALLGTRAASHVTQPAAQGSLPSLPDDIVAAILKHACAREALPTAAAVTCVCRQWRDVAHSLPCLWSHIDLTQRRVTATNRKGRKQLDDALVKRLVTSGRWSEVNHLRFSGLATGLTDASLVVIAQGNPQLASLDLTGCTELRQDNVESALRALSGLTSLDLSHTVIHPRTSGLDAVIRTALTPRPGQVSCSLRRLVVSGCPTLSRAGIQPFMAVARPANDNTQQPTQAAAGPSNANTAHPAPTQPLPHLLDLRHVDLSGSGTLEGRHQINPERWQAAAPHLEYLNITALGGVFGWDVSFMKTVDMSTHNSPGGTTQQATQLTRWPNLKVLEVGAAELYSATGFRECFSCLNDNLLLRLAGGSPLLHTLDLSNCKEHTLSPSVLAKLPCADTLRTLRLRRSILGNDEGLVVASRHFTGLEVVDVSGSSGRVTDRGVMALARAAPKLRLLDLQGSAVSAEGLRVLFDHCPLLSTLDINSCRGLTRQMRAAAQTGDVAAIKRAMD